MPDLGRALFVFAPLLLAAATRGQGYPALEIDGLAGISFVGGNSIASAGDVDGDGVPDLIVGAPYPFGGIGQVRIYSGATGALLRLFTGSVPNDFFGTAVSGAGDLDGDGLDDVVVGVNSASPGGLTSAGQAIAYSGATGAVLWTRNGTVAFETAGRSVARVGDVNGDGVEDPAIGIVYADNGPAFAAGRVEVVSGTTGVPILSVLGAGLGDNLGASLAGAGDVNGDGIPDILAGAPGGTAPGFLNVGSVLLISGATGATLLQLQGIAAGDKLGTSVAGVGDVSGDGVPDLFAGAPEPNNNGNGYVRLYSGATGAVLFTVASPLTFEEFGTSVAGPGDLSGDGVPDLLVGAPKALGVPAFPSSITGAGRVQVLSGIGGAPLFNVVGTIPNGALGSSLAGLGDVNGDGTPDFLSGEPGALGSGGQAHVRSGTSGAAIFTFQGQETGDQLGRAAAAVGDVDGDGREDLVVGAPFADAGFIPNSGRATLHSGATGAALLTVNGPAFGANLGTSVAGLGDVDGDGVPDFAAGSPADNLAAGVVRVVSGATGATLLVLNGATFGDQFGFSVAGTGDLDGDGVPDLVAGAPQGQSINVFAQGYARAHSGATGAVLGSFGGGGFSGRMGTSVAGIGDATGDGVPDVAVGAPAGAGFLSPPSPGLVRVFSGSGGGLIREIVGTIVNERFGASVAPAGDVDGDGLADVIVGAPDLSLPGASSIGGAAVYSVATGATLYVFLGLAAGERLGASVGGGRDLDGDGFEDFLLGVPGGPAAPLWPGQVRIRSGATGAPMVTLSGSAPGETFGSIVVPMGDATGDGVPDVLATSPTADPGGLADAGRARILSLVGLPAGSTPYGNGCSGTGGFVPTISTFGGAPAPGNAAFGISVARGRGGAPALLFFGSLPDLIGVPVLGCLAHLSGAVFALPVPVVLGGSAAAPGEGYRLLGIPIPPDPTLSGAQVHLQWAVVDPGSGSGLFAASAALTIVIP